MQTIKLKTKFRIRNMHVPIRSASSRLHIPTDATLAAVARAIARYCPLESIRKWWQTQRLPVPCVVKNQATQE